MSAYQSYYPNQQMNQANMGYQNFNPQFSNPYTDRPSQIQQFQQGQQMLPTQIPVAYQHPGLIGKVVNDVSAVSPNDVPMDGNIAIFPKNDMSEIYCKQWKQDGTIQTVVYKPVLDQNQSEATNTPHMDFNALNEDVRALREDIKGVRDMIEKSMAVPAAKTSQRGKKTEVSSNE